VAVHELETKPSLDTNYGLILKSQHVSKTKIATQTVKNPGICDFQTGDECEISGEILGV